MLKPNDFISIQPENRTLIEEGLEFALAAVVAEHDSPYPLLKNAQFTSVQCVSLLAAERGVLDFRPEDTELQRRSSVEHAFLIHKKAGTRKGLIDAINMLNIDAEIKRGEMPYSLHILGKLALQPMTIETSIRLNARINAYKSERDSITVILSRALKGGKTKAVHVNSAKIIHHLAGVAIPPTFYALKTRVGFMSSIKTVRVKHGTE